MLKLRCQNTMCRNTSYLSLFFLLLIPLLFTSSCSDSQTENESAQKAQGKISASAQEVRQEPQQAEPIVPAEPIFRSISPKEAYAMLRQRDDIIFLDVRTPQERAQGAIAGSQLVGFWDLIKGRVPLPNDKPILLVCAVGGRSFAAGQVLSRNGYREVYNLSGGIDSWFKAGLPISQSPNVPVSPQASN